MSQIVTTHSRGLRLVVRRSLQLLAPTLKDLAGSLGVSYLLLRRYAIGDRRAPAAVVRALVRLMRRRARALEREATRLEAATRTARR